ncbi:MAG: fasciclin domain-containing protein [Porphyromonadaceae bacterium]|nr:fasciclin domain-containing protein [Porphyromonadaceae bacterium]
MKNTVEKVFFLLVALCPLFLGTSCLDNLSYYDRPDDLKGSIYETLEDRGDYSIFLEGVDLSGFAPILKGKGIWTVMAPNDEVFASYLKSEYGITSISEMDSVELQKLIGFHILYYSFDKDMLINFRPNEGDGATEEEKMVNAGLYYKFRTKSQDDWTLEVVDTLGTEGYVYHLERFLPVFSYRMFQTKGIEARYNYEYFYPSSSWTGDDGFNVSNASVDEYAIITSSGYLYLIDQVLKPLNTIYSELESAGNFTTFLSLYDEYSYYQLDDDLTLNYGNGTDLYQHYHETPMANIASEWPVSDYTQVSALASVSYSVFAPTDEAFDSFYMEYWGQEGTGYPSDAPHLDSVSTTSIQKILLNSVYASSIVFPEEITNGTIKNTSGNAISFDVDEVPEENRKVCVNGTFYGCDVLTPPVEFGSVTGPAYQFKKYSNFLEMLSKSDLESTLCSDEIDYIVLYPSNAQMEANDIVYSDANSRLELSGSSISASNQQKYVYAHVVSVDGITTTQSELPLSGKSVLRTLSPDNTLYWYVKNGKITTSYLLDEMLYMDVTEDDIYCNFEELTFRGTSWTNGHCYAYDTDRSKILFEGSLTNAVYAKFVAMMYSLRYDESNLFSAFMQLLIQADMIDEQSQEVALMTESCLMFVPLPDVLKQAIVDGKIPGITTTASAETATNDFFAATTVTDVDALQTYLKAYFIPMSTAVISNYPYVGWGEDTEAAGGLITLDAEETVVNGVLTTVATHVNVYDDGTKLSVKVAESGYNSSNSAVDVYGAYDYFPFVFDDGCVQFINGVL